MHYVITNDIKEYVTGHDDSTNNSVGREERERE